MQSHTFCEPLPPETREEIHDWLYDHGVGCERWGEIYDGKKLGSWYVITESGFRIYNTGWVVKD